MEGKAHAGFAQAIIESARIKGLWSPRQASRRDYALCHSDPLNFGGDWTRDTGQGLGQTVGMETWLVRRYQ